MKNMKTERKIDMKKRVFALILAIVLIFCAGCSLKEEAPFIKINNDKYSVGDSVSLMLKKMTIVDELENNVVKPGETLNMRLKDKNQNYYYVGAQNTTSNAANIEDCEIVYVRILNAYLEKSNSVSFEKYNTDSKIKRIQRKMGDASMTYRSDKFVLYTWDIGDDYASYVCVNNSDGSNKELVIGKSDSVDELIDDYINVYLKVEAEVDKYEKDENTENQTNGSSIDNTESESLDGNENTTQSTEMSNEITRDFLFAYNGKGYSLDMMMSALQEDFSTSGELNYDSDVLVGETKVVDISNNDGNVFMQIGIYNDSEDTVKACDCKIGYMNITTQYGLSIAKGESKQYNSDYLKGVDFGNIRTGIKLSELINLYGESDSSTQDETNSNATIYIWEDEGFRFIASYSSNGKLVGFEIGSVEWFDMAEYNDNKNENDVELSETTLDEDTVEQMHENQNESANEMEGD